MKEKRTPKEPKKWYPVCATCERTGAMDAGALLDPQTFDAIDAKSLRDRGKYSRVEKASKCLVCAADTRMGFEV